MARRGQNQKLQTEINTDEELKAFIEAPCLLVLDIYSEWCGPCIGMVAILQKTKLEVGIDDVQFAIVKSDGIEVFRRFRNKSQPTWMFVLNGRVINSYYGSNAPELVKLIKTELELYKNGANEGRRTFALSEMNPLDIEHFAAKKMKLRLAKQAERTKETQKRRDYMQSVTDEIMMRCADMGVTAFMPHVSSGHLFDELLRVAKDLNLVPKERVTVRVSDSDFKIINFGGENLSTVLYSQMKGKDVFMICWKIPDNELRPTEELLLKFREMIIENPTLNNPNTATQEQKTIEVSEVQESIKKPERKGKKKRQGKKEKKEKEEVIVEVPIQTDEHKLTLKSKPLDLSDKSLQPLLRLNSLDVLTIENERDFAQYFTDFVIECATDKMANANEGVKTASDTLENIITKALAQHNTQFNGNISHGTHANTHQDIFYDPQNKNRVYIPAVWTPQQKRANAALIYLYFRSLTEHFLPPDPETDSPHLAMIFPANQQARLMEVFTTYAKDIMAYGYFKSENYKTAELIATSHSGYRKLSTQTSNDRLVLKVINNSEAVLELVGHLPTYVSQNVSEGKIECEHFFPDGFANEEESDDDIENQTSENPNDYLK